MRLTLFVCCFWTALVTGQLPPEIEKCKAGDSICVAETLTQIIRFSPKGLESIGLIALDSIAFDNVVISRIKPDSPATLDLKFHNLTMKGLSDATVAEAKGFEADLPRVLEISGWVPFLKFDGYYEMHGSLLTIPIQGQGQAQVEIKDCLYRCKARALKQIRADGKQYADVDKVKCLLDVQGLHLNFENLFDNPELSEAINGVANTKWREIWQTLRKGVTSAVDRILATVLKRVADKFAYEDFYRD
ncbi:uncharacterized protein LOC108098522 [Drosophila ficusphila]|uniref:uncharacterized protein LOC108098522 n=1 Tax=Drosophila ficusphila TaxID=30025 RepID=UPI0007E7694E|nr:uncharacterized protein LOC108098522 [Drosophila ficusphila]